MADKDKEVFELEVASDLQSGDTFVLGRGSAAMKILGATFLNYLQRGVVSVTARTLPPGSAATASFNLNTGLLSLGIPKGEPGDAGDMATELVAGVMRLYTSAGSNTDGTMTQKAITDSALLFDREQSLTGATSVDSSGNVTVTGQLGQAMANLKMGTMSKLDYKEIITE